MRDPRLEKLADVLVNYSVGVKKDNVVRINAPPIAMPLVARCTARCWRPAGTRSCA
jgi:leucyl aminopeptidase (aminopeptidase T)